MYVIALILIALIISITVFCSMTRMNKKQTMVALTMGLAPLFMYFHQSFSVIPLTITDVFKQAAPIFIIGYTLMIIFKDKIPDGASFAVLVNKNAPNPIFDKMIKNKIDRLLTRREYALGNPEKAKFVLKFFYTIGPTAVKEEEKPAPADAAFQSGSYDVYARRGGYLWKDPYSKGEQPSYNTHSMARGSSYTRMLAVKILNGSDFRSSGKEETVWMADVINVSPSPELQKDINYLLAAVFKYFTKDTKMRIRTLLSVSNKEVQELQDQKK